MDNLNYGVIGNCTSAALISRVNLGYGVDKVDLTICAFDVFDMTEVETSNLLATSANTSQCSFTNPTDIRALTRRAVLWWLPLIQFPNRYPFILSYPGDIFIYSLMMLSSLQLISNFTFSIFDDLLDKFTTAQYAGITLFTIS